MNKFEKVSFSEYYNSTKYSALYPIMDADIPLLENIMVEYKEIKLPKRSTAKSAGYDFYAPVAFTLEPGNSIKIATGIKAQIDDNAFLALFPRSSLGFKYRLRLDNTVGIIDSDYYNNGNNEGHIFIKITNEGTTPLTVNAEDAFAQGIFIPFLKTVDDDTTEERVGGIGSTDPQIKK